MRSIITDLTTLVAILILAPRCFLFALSVSMAELCAQASYCRASFFALLLIAVHGPELKNLFIHNKSVSC